MLFYKKEGNRMEQNISLIINDCNNEYFLVLALYDADSFSA